jgi:hypothetical protein
MSQSQEMFNSGNGFDDDAANRENQGVVQAKPIVILKTVPGMELEMAQLTLWNSTPIDRLQQLYAKLGR